MKLINEKGKLFGLINVVDLLALLAALAVVVGVCYKLFENKITEVVTPKVGVTIVTQIKGAQPYLVEELERNSPVGKKMVNGALFVEDAEIVDMQIEDYIQQLGTSDGRLVDFNDHQRKNIFFTIKGNVEKDSPIMRIGTQEVRVGRSFFVKTSELEINTTIASLTLEDE